MGIKNARRFRTRLTQTGAKPAGIFVLAGFTYFFITGRVQKDDISGGIRGGSVGDPLGIQGGSGLKKGDPSQNDPIFLRKTRGSSVRGEKLL